MRGDAAGHMADRCPAGVAQDTAAPARNRRNVVAPVRMMENVLIPWESLAQDDRPALTVAGACLTGREVAGAATAVADRVADYPVAALHATPTLATAVGYLGCLRAGVTVVPVPEDATTVQRCHLLRDSGAQVWIGSPPADPAWGLRLPVLTVDPARRSDEWWPEPDDDLPAAIMYGDADASPPPHRNGHAGRAAGVVVSRRALAAGLDGLAAAWGWRPDDVLVSGAPLFGVEALVIGLLGPLRLGGALWHSGAAAPAGYVAGVAAGGTVLLGTPRDWARLAADAPAAGSLGSARLLVSGGGPLPGPLARRIDAVTALAPLEWYGTPESLVTLAGRYDDPPPLGWVGPPIAGVAARVVDAAGEPVPTDGAVVGRLQVRGRTTFDGYLNRAMATADAWTDDGWLRTGDLAAVDARGRFRIAGRAGPDPALPQRAMLREAADESRTVSG